jgi:23S rRNA pseudouridine1911/1915/1917 synthase
MSRASVKKLLVSGRVTVNGESISRHDHALQEGDRIAVLSKHETQTTTRSRLTVVYQDNSIVAIDKPSGLLTVATDSEKTKTAYAWLRSDLEAKNQGRPYVVHRLDRETSGLLLFALSPTVRDRLQANWTGIHKVYLAVVLGAPESESGVVENYLCEGRDLRVRVVNPSAMNAQRAVTRYRIVKKRHNHSLVEAVIETGRKHQIRVHLAGLGCPVIGDDVYGGVRSRTGGRLALHAWQLTFIHPVSGKLLHLESPFPPALRKLVDGNQ